MKLFKNLLFLIALFSCYILDAQVTTNFNNQERLTQTGKFNQPYKSEVNFVLPERDVKELVAKEIREAIPNLTKPLQIADPTPVNVDIAKQIKWEIDEKFAYGKYTIQATGALSISINFDKFYLPEGTEMFVYNKNGEMITGPVTSAENNKEMQWGSWVYEGEILNIEIKTQFEFKNQLLLHASNIAYGYKEIYKVADFGKSGTCNMNVLCPLGNGWEGERNSVALVLKEDGRSLCSGSMIMNTCNTNTPYFLTANHAYQENGNVGGWRFTFQAWSASCTPTQNSNGIMFNGSTLRARNAASDFCLVELNNIPPANSNISYAGWNRDATLATQATGIHHPKGDVMKISRANNGVTVGSYAGTTNQHWRSDWSSQVNGSGAIVTPVTEGGSSGSPLFDQNHRIIGQLHGGPSVCSGSQLWDFYGRFDLSWTGGSTNTTRLSNWLDPSGSGAVITNTTNISALLNANPTLSIAGLDAFCSGTEQYIVNAPPGSTVIWSVSPSGVTSDPNPLTGNQTSLTQTGSGRVVLTASVTTCNGNLIIATKPIIVGQPPLTGTINAASSNQALYMFNNITGPNPTYVSYNWPGVSNITVTTIYSDPSASYYTYPGGFTFYLTTGGLGVRIAGNSACNGQIYLDYYFSRNYGYRMVASPNPAKGRVNVSITKITDAFSDKAQATVTASGINSKGVTKMSLYDFNTNVIVKQWTYQETETLNYDLNLTGVKAGYYVLKMERNNKVASTKILVK